MAWTTVQPVIGSLISAFSCYLNQRPWMTLNGRTAYCINLASFGAHHGNLKEDRRILWEEKCSPGTRRSASIRFMRIIIEARSVASGVNLVISVAISWEPFELEPIILRSVVKCLVVFPVTLKCLALNDLEVPFYAKNVFIAGLTWFFYCLAFGDNHVKKIEDTHVLSATKMFARNSSFWRYS